ncbi:4-oxalocrotonate tautomerase [Brevibacillus sp. NRS-1366]|uniref:4-oxalocrotonate tautomerase n=1 Tax=Brevibacillus sp. NRS-1366 TaxID=3233899 RepID=UPI003D2011D0
MDLERYPSPSNNKGRCTKMPFIQVQMIAGRPEEKVKELIANLTSTVCETLGAPKENVRVIVTEVPKSHWGIGGVPAADIPGR